MTTPTTVNVRLKLRSDTAANWTSANPTLLTGELGRETNTGKIKIGDGITAWTSLAYQGLIPSSGVYPLSQLLLPAGTVSAPSLAFDGDVNVGIYKSGTDQLAITTNGVERVEWGTTEVVFNDGGENYDFRIEGDTNANLFFVDASADRVGIGTASPAAPLDVNAGTAGTHAIFSHVAGRGLELATVAIGGTSAAGIIYNVRGAAAGTHIFQTDGNERARIDSSGRLLVGTSSAETASLGALSQIQATGSSASALIKRNDNGALPSYLYLSKSRGTTVNSTTIVQDGDSLGAIRFTGADGSTEVGSIAAQITAAVDGTPGANDMPGRLIFATTADGAATPTERMRISNSGTTTLTSAASTAPFIVNIGATEAVRIDSAGRLLVGTSTTVSDNSAGIGKVQVTTDGSYNNVLFSAHENAAAINGSYVTLARSRGSLLSPSTLISGDLIGRINFSAFGGTNYRPVASVFAEADDVHASGDLPSRLVFSTTSDGAAAPTERLRITNGGVIAYNQPAPAAVNATATLTVANLQTGIITSTTAAAVTMTLPTGTLTEGGFSGLYNNFTFEWSVINTGATNAITVQAGTDHTLVGSGTVAAGVSGRFASRRTAANTFVTYRLS